jgi:acyl-coenzyme A thioesterase PaaI-like protein
LLNIRVLENRDNWRHVRIRLPLGYLTRNLGGYMFGGCQANLADPIAAIACAHIFPSIRSGRAPSASTSARLVTVTWSCVSTLTPLSRPAFAPN